MSVPQNDVQHLAICAHQVRLHDMRLLDHERQQAVVVVGAGEANHRPVRTADAVSIGSAAVVAAAIGGDWQHAVSKVPAVGCQSLAVLPSLSWKHAERQPEIHSCHVMAEVLVEQLKLPCVLWVKLLCLVQRVAVSCTDGIQARTS
eukprot:363897-Chlamydomonas_euryale.AAC.16